MKTFYRILTALIAVTMLFAIACVSVGAADGENASLSASSSSASAGDTITFTVNLNRTGVSALSVELFFDGEAFEIVDGGWSISGFMSDFDKEALDGVWAIASAQDINSSVFSFTLKVKAGASGDSTVECIVGVNGADDKTTISAAVSLSCNHSFAEIVNSDCLVSAATCQKAAVYYKSCQFCGEKSTEIFESGSALSHNYIEAVGDEHLKTAADCENAAVYYKSCEYCKENHATETFTSGNSLGHTGGTATCTKKAVCSKCGKEYGELKEHVYDKEVASADYLIEAATCAHGSKYHKSCVCGKASTTETFEANDKKEHDFSKKDTAEKYLKSKATCKAKAVYYYSCALCGEASTTKTFENGEVLSHNYIENADEKYCIAQANCTESATYLKSCEYCGERGVESFKSGNPLGHTGGTATCTKKAVCTRCGEEYGELKEHVFDQKAEKPEFKKEPNSCTRGTIYYKSCVCGKPGTETFEANDKKAHEFTKKDTAEKYLKSKATCTAKAVYYYSCAVCGEASKSETFESGEPSGHNYLTTWSSNKTEHWHECSNCHDKKDVAAHTPGDPATLTTPQVCTVCNYVIAPAFGHTHIFSTTWSYDAEHHWYKCYGCSDRASEAAHVFDNACDTTCNTCGYTRTVSHNYKAEWSFDSSKHWHECSGCGAKKDEAAHTPGDWIIDKAAAVGVEGSKHKECTVCKQVTETAKIDAISKDTDPVTPPDTTPAETTPAETTPAETTPSETTPAETTPAVTTPTDTKPSDTTTSGGKDEKKGCFSSLSGGFVMLAMLALGVGVTTKKRK